MSQSFDPPEKRSAEFDNPYGSPMTTNRFGDQIDNSIKYPTFCLVVFIIALLLSLLRGLLFAFSVIGASMIDANSPIAGTAWAEVATGGAIFLAGVVGYGAMLARQRWGSVLGWISISGVFASIVVAVIQLIAMLPQQPNVDRPGVLVGMWVGFIFFAVIRIAIAALCGVAIIKFVRWYDSVNG